MRPTIPQKRDEDEVVSLQQLGERICTLRKNKPLAQDALAAQANIPRAHVTNIEAGRIDKRLSMLRRIAIGLEVHECDLLDLSTPVNELPNRS
jgi:transcriptional regulator with XRE-family HTH domain